MDDSKLYTFFVSEKIAKVRWVPEQIQQCQRFLTGSWDMPANFVRIWQMKPNQYANEEEGCESTPLCSDKIEFHGDVTGLEFVNEDIVASTCTDGHLALLKIKRAVEEDQLEQVARSARLHNFDMSDRAAPCTSLAICGQDIATVGEDGRLNIVDAVTLQQVKRKINADSIALYAVSYANQQEVLVANRMGVIRMFDVRAGAAEGPTHSFMTSCEDEKHNNYISCLASHPMQKHVVLAGSEEGSITVWDLRQPGYPASYLSAHTSPITEIGYHSKDPTKLFSAAEEGELWQWAEHKSLLDSDDQHETNNVWLNGDRAKSRLHVTALISKLRKAINSFDTQSTTVICGGDSEAIYIIDNS